MKRMIVSVLGLGLMFISIAAPSHAQKKDVIPHGQSQMPGPALSPAEAIRKMTVPPGFTVELVAAEPDIVNPVAMTFDERGRIWITESLEYPRSSAGPGKDRVKVLESTRGDGKYDRIAVFAEGLNIPSGIAVGHGGVWVANAPDILFYKIGPDGKAAGPPEVVVTGFGRTDTHELPNSLTWGPDGWLYGLNGVFNHSHVKHKGKEYKFTCAMFRIHPKTRDFEIFCEGTSNPWGIAFDTEGSAFVSACVIDHLWHLVETGYYHRQGGPYPPFTWKIGSIVQHKHQKAAYCGLHFFDSDAYPPEYREKLYMGNIHGNCINSDELTRDGSTYFAKPRPDFLTANDPWFMPVVQKTGPDGCLYILDWYDRYHCYQDARRDPQGIDRLRGRLYRVRYKDTPRAGLFDLSRESDDQLIQRLQSPNVYFRDLGQQLLTERMTEDLRVKLETLVLDLKGNEKAKMHALWALIGAGDLPRTFHLRLMGSLNPSFRAWGVRTAANMRRVSPPVLERVRQLAEDPSPDVQLQVAIAARKIEGLEAVPLLTQVLTRCGMDKLIPHIVWQNLHPLLEDSAEQFLQEAVRGGKLAPNVGNLTPLLVNRLLAARGNAPKLLAGLARTLIAGDPSSARNCLMELAWKVRTGELAGSQFDTIRKELMPVLRPHVANTRGPLELDAAVLASAFRDPEALAVLRKEFAATEQPPERWLTALNALTAAGDASVLDRVGAGLADSKTGSSELRGQMLAALGRLEDPRVAEVVLAAYPQMEPALRPRAIDLLTQRPAWGKHLLTAVRQKTVAPEALGVNQVRKLLAGKDPEIAKQVKALWGTLREDRNPEREKVVAAMRGLLKSTPGDPVKGQEVFKTQCAKCHKIHGEGQEVGPDITSNGRADFEQLLSNVFDPSLVIGAAYQATTVATKKGQVLTGLLVEDNAQRVVLKLEGGKVETIPRGDIDEIAVSKVSLMPEGVEKTMKEQEIADLFAFLTLDRPPGDPKARKIPGSPQ